MAYDEALADRIRALLDDEPNLTEQKMFGGLAFLVNGHMAVAASREGGVLVHVDRGASAALIAKTPAEPMIMRGRPLDGWLRVAVSELTTKRQLTTWVRRGADHARSLPPKEAKADLGTVRARKG